MLLLRRRELSDLAKKIAKGGLTLRSALTKPGRPG